MHVQLHAPDITCEHCVATIRDAVDGVEGATFISGDPDARSFVVEVTGGAVLDQIASATAAEGYPLGDAPAESAPQGAGAAGDWVPEYRVTATDRGADINYACPCGCEAGFALDRSQASQHAEGCCCGRELVVAPADAEARLRAGLDGDGYRFEVQEVTMPWGQPMQAAIAVPEEA
jgi:copper chaperone CopZ